MQRAFLPFFLLTLMLSAGFITPARARPASPQDTIMMRLPNQAVLTLTVRDAAQLRQLRNYHLDSLTSRLAGYIDQAERAAKTAQTDQVTMEFYPDKDLPGKNLPEQIRITTRKKNPNTNRVDVVLNKAFGVQVSTGPDGEKNYKLSDDKEASRARHAKRDSTRAKQEGESNNTNLIFDLGLNALVGQKAHLGAGGNLQRVDLRPEGSRYVNIGFNNRQRLGGKRSPLSLIVGIDAAFNNYMLNGNDKWVNQDNYTRVVQQADGRDFQKTKLATTSLNLPVMFQLGLRDSHHKRTFTLGAGGFVGYRIKTWTKLKYTEDGETIKDKDYGSYNMENFLYGLQGTIGYRSLELFAKYNMNSLFKENQGPETQVLSFGVRLLGN